MTIYIGADHRGFKLKEVIKEFLKNRGYNVLDVGDAFYDENDDYPDFAVNVAEKIGVEYENNRGILICASGVGMSVVANRFPKVRAGLAMIPDQAFDARNDDDSNVLVLPANYITSDVAKRILITWLETPFSGEEKFRKRLAKIDQIDEQISNAIRSQIGEGEVR